MRWWQYAQNNSGGSFHSPAHLVLIEALSADEADVVATKHGIYFNGCDTGDDCSCCGDRWSTACEPYYSLDCKLYSDQSIYLVPADRVGVLVRNTSGAWADAHQTLVERVRLELAEQAKRYSS